MCNEEFIEELLFPTDINQKYITSAFIICTYKHRVIIGYNNWRKKWELPAGKRENSDKNIEETAKREFKEETHMALSKLSLVRVARIKNTNKIRYRDIFLGEIQKFIPFKKKLYDEMDNLKLEYIRNLEELDFDHLDLYLLRELQYCYPEILI